MAKVLKVTKADKTVHVVPIGNKAFYQHMNNRVLPADKQMKLEEIDEKDAKDLPYFDESFVTASEAQEKVPGLQKRIAELEAQLASNKAGSGSLLDPASASRPYAAEPPANSTISVDEFTKQLKVAGEVTENQSPASDTTGKVTIEGAVFNPPAPPAKAEEVIAAIKEAKTVEEVNALFNGDTRKTVVEATTKRINELNEAAKQ